MKFTFMHIADVHLGYQQYGLAERSDDFYDAFKWSIDQAIEHDVDFVLLAGDLFHKRAIGALTLNQAFVALSKLRAARGGQGIPCIAVEGNHELAYYDEPIGWLHFLALQGLLVLLAPDMGNGIMKLSPWAKRRGSYIDVLPGVRVHGMKYLGAGAAAAIRQYAAALDALANGNTSAVDSSTPIEMPAYSIFMAHTGVQGVLENDHGSPMAHEWRALDAHANYIALGHIHKPFDFDDRIYNPGSLESNSILEYDWTGRGYLLVNVDTTQASPPHIVRRIETPKRVFVRVLVKVDRADCQAALAEECRTACARALRDRKFAAGENKPIVELLLTGNLPFDGAALDLRELGELTRLQFDALHVLVKNGTNKFELRGSDDDEDALSRPQLEQSVMTNLFAADARFAGDPAAWASATIQVKNLAVVKAPPAAVLDEIEASIARIES